MIFRQRLVRWGVIGLVALCVGLLGKGWLRAQSSYSEERPAFKNQEAEQAHTLMLRETRHLQAILLGFLVGDKDSVIANSEAVESAIGDIVRTTLQKQPYTTEEWRILADLSEAAHETTQLMKAGEYAQAHNRFEEIVHSCVVCHSARRAWGTSDTRRLSTDEGAMPIRKKSMQGATP
jgi:hypothetical protein